MIHVLAHGHYSAAIDGELPPLKALVKMSTGEAVRRVDRFIQLALIGAARCASHHTLGPDTAVYLTSGRGDLEITLEVLDQMLVQGQPPKPLSFINTVSNSACFHLAKQLGLHGRSLFVTRRRAPLESAFQLARLDLETGAVAEALLGSVDICTLPLDEHRQRIDCPPGRQPGEGSHWFLLAAPDYQGPSLARLTATDTLADLAALHAWLAHHSTRPDTVLAWGQHITPAFARALAVPLPTLCLPPDMPWYDSHCGALLGHFLQTQPARCLLHVDTDLSGRFHTLVLECP